MIYTGVGSRETPMAMTSLMYDIGEFLAHKGWVLRSGHADGADMAFENGCDSAQGLKEIYLPWDKFNGSVDGAVPEFSAEHERVCTQIIPWFHKMKQGAKKLHMRNLNQIAGADLYTPSRMVICWTQNGEDKGGTRTAIIGARLLNIPVFNLAFGDDQNRLSQFLKSLA